jgi:hypothetical protein
MNVTSLISVTFAGAILFTLPGCASVMSGRHADVTIYSNVPNAHVAIRDKHGKQVAATEAGSTIALKRKDKWVFPAKYTATVEAPGYMAAEVPIDAKINPWVLGNVAFLQLGLVGLAVDNVTGAAWMPSEATYYQELMPVGGPAAGPALFGATNPNPQQQPAGQQLAGQPGAVVGIQPPPSMAQWPQYAAPAGGTSAPVVQTASAVDATQPTPTYR